MTDTTTPSDVKTEEETEMTFAEEIWDVAKTVLIAVGITLFVRFFFFQPFNIPSSSMKPTLLVGDFVIVDKIDYGYSRASLIYPFTRMPIEGRLFTDHPEQGEVIVFKNGNDGNKDYIKRVIGEPGDTIQVISGVLHINGERVERELIRDRQAECGRNLYHEIDKTGPMSRLYRETLPNGISYIVQECQGNRGGFDNTQKVTVPDGHYFVMGDNRDNSDDSRGNVQFVPNDQVVGKATRIAFSVDGHETRIWEFWKWPGAIRFDRMFNQVD